MTPDPRGLPMVCRVCGEDAHAALLWPGRRPRVLCRNHLDDAQRMLRRFNACSRRKASRGSV